MTLYNSEQAVQIPTQRVEVAQSIRVVDRLIAAWPTCRQDAAQRFSVNVRGPISTLAAHILRSSPSVPSILLIRLPHSHTKHSHGDDPQYKMLFIQIMIP
ncbi:hypothetical protein HBI25_207640 [Parastagonospora nodorum]|nr:hypothetical protein HBH53_237530 [Parastagonospora nodorum]KAH4044043.1 hypothetical protein HBH49_224620 [Parastagonospora nodorum]KAH4289624.1 hypothetical protein HBI02_205200 [Parastagonospora nodorum]KAH4290013.1 hypothetical protein HBI01_204210 [Parastagonospora nodorum]KAH4322405.1 hypothetical protein HBI00_200160 [Parastagonospora nodorum]